jgi:AcrR family transcriptional regulator
VIERVLDLALEAIAREGVDRLRIPELARQAGLNKTSVYRRWPTREALVAAALDRAMGHDVPLPDTGSLHGDVVAMVERAAAWSGSPAGLATMRFLLAATPDALEFGGHEALSQAPRRILERARDRGEISADADIDLVLTLIAGACFQRQVIEKQPLEARFVQGLVSFVTRGLASDV